MRRLAAIAAALLAVALAAGCGRAERSPTRAAAPAATAAPDATTSEAERNASATSRAPRPTRPTRARRRADHAEPPEPREAPAARPTAARPAIVQRPIPFGPKRRAEMRAYAQRHYGIDDCRLRNPR